MVLDTFVCVCVYKYMLFLEAARRCLGSGKNSRIFMSSDDSKTHLCQNGSQRKNVLGHLREGNCLSWSSPKCVKFMIWYQVSKKAAQRLLRFFVCLSGDVLILHNNVGTWDFILSHVSFYILAFYSKKKKKKELSGFQGILCYWHDELLWKSIILISASPVDMTRTYAFSL